MHEWITGGLAEQTGILNLFIPEECYHYLMTAEWQR